MQLERLEHEVRFRKLHDKVSDTIGETFARLSRVYTNTAQFISILGSTEDPEREKQLESLSKSFDEFNAFVGDNRLFIPRSLLQTLDEFRHKVYTIAIQFKTNYKQERAGRLPDHAEGFWSKADADFKNQVVPLFEKIYAEAQEDTGLSGRPLTFLPAVARPGSDLGEEPRFCCGAEPGVAGAGFGVAHSCLYCSPSGASACQNLTRASSSPAHFYASSIPVQRLPEDFSQISSHFCNDPHTEKRNTLHARQRQSATTSASRIWLRERLKRFLQQVGQAVGSEVEVRAGWVRKSPRAANGHLRPI